MVASSYFEMPVTWTLVSGWRWPCRLWYPVLFLNLWIRIFGPLVCSTTVAVTEAAASAAASVVTSSPSTRSTAGRLTSAPGFPSIFSTVTTSSTATLYCLPPVLTIAYIDALLLKLGGRSTGRTRRGPHPVGGRRRYPRVRKGI